jgi:hypothetical protein
MRMSAPLLRSRVTPMRVPINAPKELAGWSDNAMARCIALDIDCAAMCQITSAAMARGSECASVMPRLRRCLRSLR